MSRNRTSLEVKCKSKAPLPSLDILKDILPSSEDESNTEVDVQEWICKMMQNGYWCDHAFLQLASNYLNKDFVILPINPEDGHNGTDRIVINAKSSIGEPFYFLHYSNRHFQSIRPKLDANAWGGPDWSTPSIVYKKSQKFSRK